MKMWMGCVAKARGLGGCGEAREFVEVGGWILSSRPRRMFSSVTMSMTTMKILRAVRTNVWAMARLAAGAVRGMLTLAAVCPAWDSI